MSINNTNIIPPSHQIKNPPFLHQHSSTNSSSPSSSSPSSYSYSYSYSDHSSPIWSFSNLDPMISIFSPNNNNLVNPTTPLLFPQDQARFNMISPMVQASCSSNSDGSGENQSYQEPPLLDYGLEEIKQLITSTSCTNFFFDDQTT